MFLSVLVPLSKWRVVKDTVLTFLRIKPRNVWEVDGGPPNRLVLFVSLFKKVRCYFKLKLVPCFVPETENGIYIISKTELQQNISQDFDQPLNSTTEITNGQVVEFSCLEGYNVQGPSNLRCWHGEWTVSSLPECTASPCQLPHIRNGQYLHGYRAGLTIANASSVTFQCDKDFLRSTSQPIQCVLGQLYPRTPYCKRNGSGVVEEGVDSPHYIGGGDIIKGGDITVLQYGAASKICGPPAK